MCCLHTENPWKQLDWLEVGEVLMQKKSPLPTDQSGHCYHAVSLNYCRGNHLGVRAQLDIDHGVGGKVLMQDLQVCFPLSPPH